MRRLAPVAVTGAGCLCSAGHTLDACMDALFAGRRRCGPPTTFAVESPRPHPVFEVADGFWRPERFPLETASRTVQLTLTAAREALADAGVGAPVLEARRVGVCIGTNVAGAVGGRHPETAGPGDDIPYVTAADRFAAVNPTAALVRNHRLRGPIQTVVTACSAGGDAIGLGAAWIRAGLCDLVIAGGADELYERAYTGFISLMNYDDAPCRPFDARRKGLNLGEGAGILILESDEMRKDRGKAARGVILGYGAAGDAYHLTRPDPEGRGLARSVREALDASGLSPADLAFINAHGTGTPDNDRIESRLFHETFPGIPFCSTKGYTGHTLGAAGAVEAAFTLACLERGRLPASMGYGEPDPDLPAIPTDRNTPVTGRFALSQTLAFGGNNAALILGLPGEAEEPAP